MEEGTTLCSNCQRPIAAANFVTHSLHCQRNLVKCTKCGEAVPRSGMEEHDNEIHTKICCPDCRVMVEKPMLDSHKKTSCRNRQQGCCFCELELPANEMSEHELYCGSRTKKCEDCGEYVMIKYEQLHLDSNHGFLKLDDEPGPTATWIKNDIESGGSKGAKLNNNKKPQLSTGKFENADEDDYDEVYSLFSNLMKNNKPVSAKPPNYPGVAYPISGTSQRTLTRSPQLLQDLQDDSADLVALPCEFCDAMIPVNQLLLHQTGCRPDIASLGKVNNASHSSQNDLKKQLSNAHRFTDEIDHNIDFDDERGTQHKSHSSDLLRRNAIDKTLEASLKSQEEDDDILLPCEFCADGYPPSLLLEHQNVCDYRPKTLPDATPSWTEPQDFQRPNLPFPSKQRRFHDGSLNTYVDSDESSSNSARGKSNISNSYNDLRGNFTVASEWSDDSDSRPTSATGAIPKMKAGKLNLPWKIKEEVPSSRPSNSVMANHSRSTPNTEALSSSSSSDLNERFRIRNNLKDLEDDDES